MSLPKIYYEKTKTFPSQINFIPKDSSYHITTLIEDMQIAGKRIGVYTIDDEAWIDVGQWS